jgi:hypothetical protein
MGIREMDAGEVAMVKPSEPLGVTAKSPEPQNRGRRTTSSRFGMKRRLIGKLLRFW